MMAVGSLHVTPPSVERWTTMSDLLALGVSRGVAA